MNSGSWSEIYIGQRRNGSDRHGDDVCALIVVGGDAVFVFRCHSLWGLAARTVSGIGHPKPIAAHHDIQSL